MMISMCLILILLNEILLGNGEKEHVHFKIHVPEIIKHHIHTKTIFVHKLVPRKKYIPKKKEIPKKTKKPSYHNEEDHKDDHHEWKYWSSSYFHHDDNGKTHHDANHEVKQEEGSTEGYQDQKEYQNYVHPDSYFPQRDSHNEYLPLKDHANGLIGYSYPPQFSQNPNEVYEISEKGQEKPIYNYEEGYQKGLQSESGAIYTKELNKYNFGTEEEEEEKSKDEEEEEDTKDIVKTHAGRYFVTEEDVEHDHSHERSNPPDFVLKMLLASAIYQ